MRLYKHEKNYIFYHHMKNLKSCYYKIIEENSGISSVFLRLVLKSGWLHFSVLFRQKGFMFWFSFVMCMG